jgi:hypothetical protein
MQGKTSRQKVYEAGKRCCRDGIRCKATKEFSRIVVDDKEDDEDHCEYIPGKSEVTYPPGLRTRGLR